MTGIRNQRTFSA